MKIRISDGRGAAGHRLRAQVQRRLEFILGAFRGQIESVVVQLSLAGPPRRTKRVKAPGPRSPAGSSKMDGAPAGAPASHCRIEVTLRARTVGAEDTDPDPLEAVGHAAARLRRTVARALELERAMHADQPLPLPPPPPPPAPAAGRRRGR